MNTLKTQPVRGLDESGLGRTAASSASDTETHFSTDHLLSDLKRHTISGGLFTGSAQVAKFLLYLGSTVVLARLLTPRDFGLVAMVTAVTGFLTILRHAGLATPTMQCEHITQAQVSNLFWVNLAVSGMCTLIAAALAPVLAWFYHDSRLVAITLALSMTFLIGGFRVQHLALLRRQLRFKALAIIDVGSMALGVAVAIIMALMRFGYWSLVGLSLATELGSFILTGSISRWRPQWPSRRSGVGPLLSFGASVAASSFIGYLSSSVDSVLIGWRYGANSVGLYSRAVALLARPIEQLMYPISSVFVPALARLQSNPARYRRAFLLTYEAIAVVTFFCTSIIFALAHPLTLVLLGRKWERTADIFACFTIVALIRPLVMGAYWLLTTQARGRSMIITTSILSISSIVSFIAGLPFGPTGVAIAFSISGLIIRLPVIYYTCGRTGPVRTADLWGIFLRHLPLWIFVFVATYVTRIVVSHEIPLIQLFICMPVGLLAGAAFIWSVPAERAIVIYLLTSLHALKRQTRFN